MEECINHFSHEHQLNFFQVDADEDSKPHRCRICALPILSTPSYTCTSLDTNCNFFVHKPCTQLPDNFYHHLHLKLLRLTKPSLPLGETSGAGDSFRNFTYKFSDSSRELDLHPLVAKPVEIKSRHRSHTAHPLVVFCKEIVCRCDVCGEKETGFFFYCKECGFFVHQDCAILPSVVKLPSHPHPFILAYYLPFSEGYNTSCSICGREWHYPDDGGVYFCGECYSLAHVACAKPTMENVISDKEFLHLPDEEDTFPSLAIRRFIERNPSSTENIKTGNKILTKYHEHPLILGDAATSDDNAVCDICIQPINMSISPFYRCHDCHFVAHSTCAHHLPTDFELLFGSDDRVEGVLLSRQYQMGSFFNSVFRCLICSRPSNGCSYKITNGVNKNVLDVECAGAPKTVKHASHKNHILFFTGNRWISDTYLKTSCCSYKSFFTGIYRCVVCDYSIHIRCALLPKTTRHKFDEHPLELIMSNEDKQGLFCEVCEQDIDFKWWYYGCYKCEQYFHINCIPSVGLMSKVKFGKTHVDYELHQHPVTLTRMLTHQRHERCGKCNEIIKGFSDDEMAFHCSLCDFWIHFSCAAAISGLMDYSKHMFIQLSDKRRYSVAYINSRV